MSKKVDFIIAHAQQATKTKEEKDELYRDLQALIDESPKRNIQIIMGDMNAKVISPENDEEEQTMGKYTIANGRTPADLKDGTEENRRLLLNFCIENEMKLMNTTFTKPKEKLISYRPIGINKDAPITDEAHEQIDYIITKRKTEARIVDCETDTNMEINTDHYPMIAKMNMKFRRINKEAKEIYRYNDKAI